MSTSGHLWAIGYDDIQRADQVRDEITRLGWGTRPDLRLADVAVVVRHPDGSFTFDREPFPTGRNILGGAAYALLVLTSGCGFAPSVNILGSVGRNRGAADQ